MGSIPKQFWEQCPNVTTLMRELGAFRGRSAFQPVTTLPFVSWGTPRPSSHFGDNAHFREKTVRGEIKLRGRHRPPPPCRVANTNTNANLNLKIRCVECSFHELCTESSWFDTVIVPALVDELRSLASFCHARGYRLLDGDGVGVLVLLPPKLQRTRYLDDPYPPQPARGGSPSRLASSSGFLLHAGTSSIMFL
jgi:hypothetical protein